MSASREYIDEKLIPALAALEGVTYEFPCCVVKETMIGEKRVAVWATPNWDVYDEDESDFLPLDACDWEGEPFGESGGTDLTWTGDVVVDVERWRQIVEDFVASLTPKGA